MKDMKYCKRNCYLPLHIYMFAAGLLHISNVHIFPSNSLKFFCVEAFVGVPVLRSKQPKIISAYSTISTSSNPKTRLLSLYQSLASPPLPPSEPEPKPPQTQRLSVVLKESTKELRKHSNDTVSTAHVNKEADRDITSTKERERNARSENKIKSRKNKRSYRNPKDVGPYADFTEKELFELTENLLSCTSPSAVSSSSHTQPHIQIIPVEPSVTSSSNQEDVDLMTRQQLHEISRLMSSWTKRGVEQSGILTERLLNKVIDEKTRGNKRVTLTPIMFHIAITAWLNCGPKKKRV